MSVNVTVLLAHGVLQHEGREITVKKEFLKWEKGKIQEIQPDLPQVLRPDTGSCTQFPPTRGCAAHEALCTPASGR
jgi:hypothetical protein